jgi:cell division protein FtsB
MCKLQRPFLLLLLAAVIYFPLVAQSPGQAPESASLREQFDAMVRGSNRYQQYRVVPQTELNQFIQSVSDTLAARAAELSRLEAQIATQTRTITESQAEIESLKQQIEQLEAEKDGIYLLGVLVSKATYNIVLWTLILAAVAGLVFFFLRARLAIATSRGLQQDKDELATALDTAKKRRLEVEQDLRRKLQDEINKRLD